MQIWQIIDASVYLSLFGPLLPSGLLKLLLSSRCSISGKHVKKYQDNKSALGFVVASGIIINCHPMNGYMQVIQNDKR